MSSIPKKDKILFLYSELSGYFLSCLEALAIKSREIHVVHFPVNPEAPFQFNYPDGVNFHPLSNFTDSQLKQFVQKLNPNIMYCSGWMHKPYLSVCAMMNKKVPVILGLDNPWKGTIKQRLGVLVYTKFTQIFTHCWVPGERQRNFASRLGFDNNQIMKGVYAADVNLFNGIYANSIASKKSNFPKVFVFSARYNTTKGLEDLISVWQNHEHEFKGWKLICSGTGNLDSLVKNAGIKNHGFVQQKNMYELMAASGVYILPSRYEPWGVSVQEFAAAGFPLICSDEVGAGEVFLQSNGMRFKAGDRNGLKNRMLEMVSKSDSELCAMAAESNRLSFQYTPDSWSDTLLNCKI